MPLVLIFWLLLREQHRDQFERLVLGSEILASPELRVQYFEEMMDVAKKKPEFLAHSHEVWLKTYCQRRNVSGRAEAEEERAARAKQRNAGGKMEQGGRATQLQWEKQQDQLRAVREKLQSRQSGAPQASDVMRITLGVDSFQPKLPTCTHKELSIHGSPPGEAIVKFPVPPRQWCADLQAQGIGLFLHIETDCFVAPDGRGSTAGSAQPGSVVTSIAEHPLDASKFVNSGSYDEWWCILAQPLEHFGSYSFRHRFIAGSEISPWSKPIEDIDLVDATAIQQENLFILCLNNLEMDNSKLKGLIRQTESRLMQYSAEKWLPEQAEETQDMLHMQVIVIILFWAFLLCKCSLTI